MKRLCYFLIVIGNIAYVNGIAEHRPWVRYPGLLAFCIGLLILTGRVWRNPDA